MAKPIELGLTLEGEDAKKFHEYMKKPTHTKKGIAMAKKAAKRAGILPSK